MKKSAEHLSKFRVKDGEAATTDADGMSGNFTFKINDALMQVSSEEDVSGWNHLIVVAFDKSQSSIISRLTARQSEPRCPTNEEVMHVKRLFFDDEELCVEFVPSKGCQVPWHHIARHVWCRTFSEFPTPKMNQEVN